ncbi:MAG: hypothetical protein HRU09_09890 [Oligoflexales bacterium]|nr:hypothetical protein [Oligoflexales bacterium]
MSTLMSKIVLSVFLLSILACGTNEEINRGTTTDYGNNNSTEAQNASITLETKEITEESFEKKEKEGESLFTADVMDKLTGHSLEETDQTEQASTKIEVAANQPKKAEETLKVVNEENSADAQAAAPASAEEELEAPEESAEEAYDEEKYQASIALAQSEMHTKVDALIPNAPFFMKDKLKGNTDDLLLCGDDCEDQAKSLMVTSYSVSRFLENRGLGLAATDINAAIAAASKLLSDVALIILEATAPEPDPTTIIMLVDIFMADLRELIMAFL